MTKKHADLKKQASRKNQTEVVTSLEDKATSISTVETVMVPTPIITYFLKIKVQFARASQKLGMTRDAQTAANEIIEFVRILIADDNFVDKLLASALKAAEVTCDLLTQVREFSAAQEVVNEVAEALVLKINKKYGTVLGIEEQDKSKPVEKKLADSHYSFAVRRLRARVHLAFSEVNEAGPQLEELLKDQVEFYHLKAAEGTQKVDILDKLKLPQINLNVDSQAERHSSPLMLVASTLCAIAYTLPTRGRRDDAVELLDFVRTKIYGDKHW